MDAVYHKDSLIHYYATGLGGVGSGSQGDIELIFREPTTAKHWVTSLTNVGQDTSDATREAATSAPDSPTWTSWASQPTSCTRPSSSDR